MQAESPAAYRQARIVDLCQDATSQGALLTWEDLAYRVFFVNLRTISRNLEALRQANPETPIPLRSTVRLLKIPRKLVNPRIPHIGGCGLGGA